MMLNLSKIRSTEFGLCHHFKKGNKKGREYALIPVDSGVQNELLKMLRTTLEALDLGGEKLEKYEFSQKYETTARLEIPLAEGPLETLRAFYETENIAINLQRIKNLKDSSFYFVTFRDNQKNKLIGIRRTKEFKGVVSAKNRLMRWADDALTMVEDDIFKLDKDFDYLISEKAVYILRPIGFEQTADVQKHLKEHAKNNTEHLKVIGSCINLKKLAQYVEKRPRAWRLVASISSRVKLKKENKISPDKLKDSCEKQKIAFEEKDGQILPKPGNEMAFLELLDRRRYTVSLIENKPPEFYKALNRKPVALLERKTRQSGK